MATIIAPLDFDIRRKAADLRRLGYDVSIDYRNDVVEINGPGGPRYLCGRVAGDFLDELGETFKRTTGCTVRDVALSLAEPWIN